VDSETLARLRSITQEMQQALEEREQQAADVEASATGLKDLLLRFESEHPQLSVSIGRVADALAAMGI
jgi:hypothetical protein